MDSTGILPQNIWGQWIDLWSWLKHGIRSGDKNDQKLTRSEYAISLPLFLLESPPIQGGLRAAIHNYARIVYALRSRIVV